MEDRDANEHLDLEPRVPTEVEGLCLNCHEQGTVRLLLVPDAFFPSIVITSFYCPHCHYKDKQVIEVEESSGKGVEIDCAFDRPEDLRRHAVVPSGTEVSIESRDKGVSFTQSEDAIVVIESLIRGVLEKMISAGTMPEDKFSEEEFEALGEYKETAMFLQESMENIGMRLVLKDPKGVARVFPVGEIPRGSVRDLPLSHFADERVSIREYEVPKSHEEPGEP